MYGIYWDYVSFQDGNSKRILEVFLVTWIALHHFTQREAVGEIVGREVGKRSESSVCEAILVLVHVSTESR